MTAIAVVADRARVPAAELRHLEPDDAAVLDGVPLPARPFDLTERHLVWTGAVEDAEAVGAAVLAAVRGVRLSVGCPDPALRAVLVGDLRRLGEVRLMELGPDPADVLDDDQLGLLAHLAAGASIAAAASEVLLSPRTAERRLGAARKALGVRTTAEAIALVGG